MKKQRLTLTLKSRNDLTSVELKRHFYYDHITGDFTRIMGFTSWGEYRPCRELITSSNNKGYKWVRFKNKQFLVHRLIFLFMTGNHPVCEVDHINGDRKDNRWINLRDISPFENSRNQGNRKDNKSGVRGVTWHEPKKGRPHWKARISHKGVRYDLGNYQKKEDAVKVRLDAETHFKYHHNHAKRESWVK